MDFLSILKTRRSVRTFQEREVALGTIKQLIEIATYAPSACNVQGWRFIIVEDKEIKQKIVDMGGSINIKNGPVGILVLYDNRTKNTEYSDDIQSAAAAIQNLLLAAHYLELGACWTCHLPPKRHLRKLFKIPRTLSPAAYIMVGHKEMEPVSIPRKYELDEIIDLDTFSSKKAPKKRNIFKLLILKTLMRIYYLIPFIIRKKWLNKYVDKRFVKKFEN